MSLMLLPLYVLLFAAVPLSIVFVAYEIVMLLSKVNIKRSKREMELFN